MRYPASEKLEIIQLVCKSASTFDPGSAPIQHVSYWLLVYRWVSFRCRFTAGFAKNLIASNGYESSNKGKI